MKFPIEVYNFPHVKHSETGGGFFPTSKDQRKNQKHTILQMLTHHDEPYLWAEANGPLWVSWKPYHTVFAIIFLSQSKS